MKILFITIGGSPEPNKIAINSLNPDYIFFVCSKGDKFTGTTNCVDGEGYFAPQTKEKLYDNLLKLTGYKSLYKKIEIDDSDDINEIIRKTKKGINEAKKKNPKEIILDYTGGTKSMSAAFVLLATFDRSLKLTLTKGQKTNYIKTEDESITELVNISYPRFENIIEIVNNMLGKYLYTSARTIIEKYLSEEFFETDLRNKLEEIKKEILIFEKWDKFDHNGAYEFFRKYHKTEDFKEHFNYLLRILNKSKNSGYEILFDLIKNAERKAENRNYDDAVARIYRGIELFLQIRLKKKFGIDTSDLELKKIPEEFREEYKDKKSIGLMEAYELLEKIDNELKEIFSKYKGEIRGSISVRNKSILAHGTSPIKEEDYKIIKNCFDRFIQECVKKIGLGLEYQPYFPKIIEM